MQTSEELADGALSQLLTERSLRKHNKRRGSREEVHLQWAAKHALNLKVSQSNLIPTRSVQQRAESVMKRLHHHQQRTLSEPMLPKFALMMMDSSEDEKSGSSDGEDGHSSLGMDIHLNDTDHTHEIAEDDPQLKMSLSTGSNAKTVHSPTFTAVTADSGWSMSRRSSMTAVELGSCNGTSPGYSTYKTRHEYVRDMNYFTTLHRAQNIGKWFVFSCSMKKYYFESDSI